MNTYTRLGTASLIDVISKVHVYWNDANVRAEVNGHSIGVSSLRMKTFGRDTRASGGIACRACGLEAEFFGIETFARGNQTTPHANLYGVKDGEEILFTHDHILARALGGEDNLSNTQTMCSPCNSRKSRGEKKEVDRRRALTKAAEAAKIQHDS